MIQRKTENLSANDHQDKEFASQIQNLAQKVQSEKFEFNSTVDLQKKLKELNSSEEKTVKFFKVIKEN